MLYTIRNHRMTVTVSSLGAELMSVTGADKTEYLWNGDPAFWHGRAPILFPYVGKQKDGQYTLDGKRYPLGKHGFTRHKEFSLREQTEDHISLFFSHDEDTLSQYPFPFVFTATFSLKETTLHITFSVENVGEKPMYFGLGGHPAFRLPMEPDLSFEDYRVEFAHPCHPARVELGDDFMISGHEPLYPLEEDRYMPLRHQLFRHDAVILRHIDKTVSLRSPKGVHGVTVQIPQMQYLGVWHMMDKDCPFVCLEPWASLPARHGVTEDLSQQADLIYLPAGEIYHNRWSISIF